VGFDPRVVFAFCQSNLSHFPLKMNFQNLKDIFEGYILFTNISDNRCYDLSDILWDQDKFGYLSTICYRNSHLDDNIHQTIHQINYDGPPIHSVVGTNYVEAQHLNHRFSINNTLGFTTFTLIFKFSVNDELIIKQLFDLHYMLYEAKNILLPLDTNLNDFLNLRYYYHLLVKQKKKKKK
jgi:hypothetical protein